MDIDIYIYGILKYIYSRFYILQYISYEARKIIFAQTPGVEGISKVEYRITQNPEIGFQRISDMFYQKLAIFLVLIFIPYQLFLGLALNPLDYSCSSCQRCCSSRCCCRHRCSSRSSSKGRCSSCSSRQSCYSQWFF